tara:strand:- start:569 stop:1348 length:780 start_codon:yes stop_codon:yes gene_type:complete
MRTSNIPGLADALNHIEARLAALEQNPVRLVDGLGTRIEQSGTDYSIHVESATLPESTRNPFQVIKGKNDDGDNAIRIAPDSFAWTMPEGGANISLANVGTWHECVGAVGANEAACEAAGGKWTQKHPWIDLPAAVNAAGHLVYLEFSFQDNSGGLLDATYAYADAGLGAGNAKGKVFIADDFDELSEDEGADGTYELHAGGSASAGYHVKHVRIPLALLTLENAGGTMKVATVTQYRTTNVRLWAAGFDAVPALYPLD